MSVYPRSKSGEIWGIILLSFSLLVYLALFSNHPFDPSFNVAAPHSGYQNLIGRLGAWTSDLLLQLFGVTAFLLPIPLIIVSIRRLRSSEIDSPGLKAAGFVGALVSLASLLTMLESRLPQPESYSLGGVVGILVSRAGEAWLNYAGALLLLSTVLLLSVVITTQLSLVGSIHTLFRLRPRPLSNLQLRWKFWSTRRQDRKKLEGLNRSGRKVVAQPMPSQVSDGASVDESDQPSDSAPPSSTTLPTLQKPPTPSRTQETEWSDDGAVRPSGDRVYQLPEVDFLQEAPDELDYDEKELLERAQKLSMKCAEFDVTGQVLQIHPGPVVTTFEFKPDPGVKYSRITNLSEDLCLALRAESIRIDRVPGKNTVGIEVPNKKRRIIYLKEVLDSSEFHRASSRLTLSLGQQINGATAVADLGRMPHLLIAGSTGSGKSVGLNCMVCSILYKATPKEVRFIMVDPKRLELGLYEDIPHLLTPIVTDPKKAANALNWAVREMEDRYRRLAQFGVRNISQYNEMIRSGEVREEYLNENEEPVELPYIVILVDELADLMMTAGKEVETAVTRLAQMARAVGIHLILATQRPSVDVITGLIKANFPSRISFRVSSKIDSRTILDTNGAEQLLGMGDMLYLSPETSRLVRIHGAYISEKEISRIVRFLKKQGEPDYREEVLMGDEEDSDAALIDVSEMEDKLFDEATQFIVESRKASTSLLQRRFRIGYGRAARLLDMMEHEGIVGPSEGSRPREVLVPVDYFSEIDERDN